LDAVLDDLAPNAVKTGALGSAAIVRVVAERLERMPRPLVVDTVRIAKHDAALLEDDARELLLEQLLPRATLVTANAPEAAWLTGSVVASCAQAIAAAERLRARGCAAVMIKGGHLEGATATDVLLDA